MTPLDLLREHIGHETRPVEPNPGRSIAIRCIRCKRTIDLSAVFGLRPGGARPTSTSQSAAPRDPRPDQTCPRHPGEFQGACRSCAADRLERKPTDPPPISQVRTGVDPMTVPEYAAAKAALTHRETQRKRQQRALDQARTDQPDDLSEGSPS
jgi:hypothetical protein